MRKQSLFITVLAVVLQAGVVSAQEYDLGNIVVSATRSEIFQAETGSSTTVITSEQIESSGKLTVEGVLRSVPGVSVSAAAVSAVRSRFIYAAPNPGILW